MSKCINTEIDKYCSLAIKTKVDKQGKLQKQSQRPHREITYIKG